MKRVRFDGGLWHGQIRSVDQEKRTIGFGGKVQGMYLIGGYVVSGGRTQRVLNRMNPINPNLCYASSAGSPRSVH
jgi:hypothetical protein